MNRLLTVIAITGLLMLTGCATKDTNTTNDNYGYDDNDTQVDVDDSQENTSSNTQTMQKDMPVSGDTIAIITTNKGVMKAKLFPEQTPETVKNFTELAKADKYDGTIFHRVINNFMIQGGDFETRDGRGGHSYKGPGTMIEDEFNPELKNIRGALSMANRGPNTNGSQFFIVHAENTEWLDGKHAVFGQVYEGLDVLDSIAEVEVDMLDRPTEEVVVEDIEISTFEAK